MTPRSQLKLPLSSCRADSPALPIEVEDHRLRCMLLLLCCKLQLRGLNRPCPCQLEKELCEPKLPFRVKYTAQDEKSFIFLKPCDFSSVNE